MFLNKVTKVKKYLAVSAAFFAAGMLVSNPAAAQSFQQLYNNTLTDQLFSFADFMSALAYLAGIAFGIKAALKLKEWNESKGRDATLTQALIPLVIAGMLLGLPTVLSVAKGTVGGNSQSGAGIGSNSGVRNIQ